MPRAQSGACWRALLLGSSALVLLAERAALIGCFVYYLCTGHALWAGLTLGLALPGTAVQLLSYLWHRNNGEQRRCFLLLIHLLHLGIFKRFGDCVSSVGSVTQLGVSVMRQAEVSALHLLEALLLTLPQILLHTYILLTADTGHFSPVAPCCGLGLLSLSWALVLYSRACSLIRPGHLAMPPAALLCQFLWRVGMLASRIACLVAFTRIFHWWVCGVVGLHWIVASFWLVSQRSDIFTSPWRRRVFNCTLGAVHVFFFLNVKDGPSRFRMAGFYVVMLLENASLLISASEFPRDTSWKSLSLPVTAMSSFILGTTALILYYRFLHPKSTEISQSLRQEAVSENGDSSYTLGSKAPPFPSTHKHNSHAHLGGLPAVLREHVGGGNCKVDGQVEHHHWLLIRLAMKTGDAGRISLAYGNSGEGAGDSQVKECEASRELKCALAPLSDCKDEFQSMSEATSPDASLEMTSPPESPTVCERKRGSPEGKSVLAESPEHCCPTESSSTLYFSADPQSPSSTSNPEISAIPIYTSTPKLDLGPLEAPHSLGPRRQLMPPGNRESGRF